MLLSLTLIGDFNVVQPAESLASDLNVDNLPENLTSDRNTVN